MLIRSLKFVVSSDVPSNSVQQWVMKRFTACTAKYIRAIVFTSLEKFRTVLPRERRFKLDTQNGMPWLHRQQMPATIYFTGNDI